MKLIRSLLISSVAALASVIARADVGYAVTSTGLIVQFDPASPAAFQSSFSVSGLRMSDGVTGDPFGYIAELAYHPGQNWFYGLDGNANFYSIDVTTGVATFVSSALNPFGFDAGLAYDPFVGSFRFVSDAAENITISTAGVVTVGGAAFFGAGDVNEAMVPVFTGLGIDPAFGNVYALDTALGVLAQSFDPAASEFFTVGALGLSVTGFASLDVDSNGMLYASLSGDALTSALYSIDASTGAASKIGDFNTGVGAVAFAPSAIPPVSAVPEPSTYALMGAGALVAIVAIRRRRNA